MHARRSKTKGSPDAIPKAKQVIEGSAIAKIKDLAGFRGGYWLIDPVTGHGLTFTFFDTKENLEASSAQANQIRTAAVAEIGAEVLAVDEFEVALDTGQKIHRNATHARVAEFEGEASQSDQTISMLKEHVLPNAAKLPGFQGGFWLVDRSSGKGVGVTLFDSAANIAASREAANAIRERASQNIPGTVGEFKEYEVLARAETPAGVGAS